jgi:hypothetical protein
MNDELVRFVREALAKGVPKSEISTKLLEAHWPEDEVKNALEAYADLEFPIPVPRPKPYLSAREAFLYLVLFSTLYTSAISFGSLLYQFIGRAFPHPATRDVVFDQLSAVRWSTASLIIAFPVFLLLSRTMYRAIRRDPEKRTSKIRKWLTYLTLFVAAGVLLADLITLVFNLLGGELTARFLLKVLTVGGIAGSVFGYYLWDLRQDDVEPERWVAKHLGVRVFSGVIIAAVAAGVIGGLYLAGSPEKARLARLDDRREVDLQLISRAVDFYWSQKRELPPDLEQLSRERGVRVRSIRDPETAEPYEYRITGEKTYELCAVFDREDDRPEERYPIEPVATGERFWSHGAGRVCFPVEVKALRRVFVEREPAQPLEEEGVEESRDE